MLPPTLAELVADSDATRRRRVSITGTACAAPPGSGSVDLYTCHAPLLRLVRAQRCSRLDPHDIASQLGHRDGGALVRGLYGHPDAAIARQRIQAAYNDAPTAPVPLRRAS